MKSIGILFFCLFIAAEAQAVQGLTDPTRPPQEWLEAPVDSESEPANMSWPEVQAVMKRQGRYLALIDGQWLAEGDQWQDNKIIRIRPTEVTFAGPSGPVSRSVGSSNIIKKVAKDEV